MSDPMVETGARRRHTCSRCNRSDVEQIELVGAFAGTRRWATEWHDAPCGLACFGGGVHGALYRSGRFHRDRDNCPVCRPGTSGRARDAETR